MLLLEMVTISGVLGGAGAGRVEDAAAAVVVRSRVAADDIVRERESHGGGGTVARTVDVQAAAEGIGAIVADRVVLDVHAEEAGKVSAAAVIRAGVAGERAAGDRDRPEVLVGVEAGAVSRGRVGRETGGVDVDGDEVFEVRPAARAVGSVAAEAGLEDVQVPAAVAVDVGAAGGTVSPGCR